MTRFLAACALIAGAVLLQLSWVPRLEFDGAYMTVPLVLVVGLTWTRGFGSAVFLSLLAGVLLDFLHSEPLGLHSLAMCAACYAAALLQERYEPTPLLVVLAATLATIVYTLTLVALRAPAGPHIVAESVTGSLVAACVLNAALLLVTWKPLTLFARPAPVHEEVGRSFSGL